MKSSFRNLVRRGILFLFLIGLSETSFSQAFVFGNSPSYTALNMKNKKPLDTVLLEVRYQFTWTYANNSQPHTEQRTLLIGRNHIYLRNEALYQNDSVATSLIAKGAKGVPLYSNPTIPYEVWTNIQAKTVEIGYRVPFDNLIISFIQPANELQWSFFEDEKQKILGYVCSKATTTYRGKNVVAWFSEELPYDAGPYCFMGLPGLIMKIELEGASWQAIGIRKGKNYEQIYTFARPQQKMTREKAISFLTNLYNDPVATYSALGVECSSTEKPDQVLTSGSIKWEIPNLMKMER